MADEGYLEDFVRLESPLEVRIKELTELEEKGAITDEERRELELLIESEDIWNKMIQPVLDSEDIL